MRDSIRVMSYHGDEKFEYDSDDPNSVADMKKKVKEYLKKGYFMVARDKDGKDHHIKDADDIENKKYDSFLLSKDFKKILVPAVAGGAY